MDKYFIQYFEWRINDTISKITVSKEDFTLDELIKELKPYEISKHVVKNYLDHQIRLNNIKRLKLKKRKRGRPMFRYIKNINFQENICEKCHQNNIAYHCSHCGLKTCPHLANFENQAILCPKCNNEKMICPECFTNLILTLHKNSQINIRAPRFLIPIKENDKYFWYCSNPDCGEFGKRKHIDQLYWLYNNLDVQQIIEAQEEYEHELAAIEEIEKNRQEFKMMQGELVIDCSYKEKCIVDECPNSEVDNSNVEQIRCPNGLIYADPECYFCEDCQYLDIFPNLSPGDEEFMDFRCIFLDTLYPDDNEFDD